MVRKVHNPRVLRSGSSGARVVLDRGKPLCPAHSAPVIYTRPFADMTPRDRLEFLRLFGLLLALVMLGAVIVVEVSKFF